MLYVGPIMLSYGGFKDIQYTYNLWDWDSVHFWDKRLGYFVHWDFVMDL